MIEMKIDTNMIEKRSKSRRIPRLGARSREQSWWRRTMVKKSPYNSVGVPT